MITKHLAVLLASISLACLAAAGVCAADPSAAEAAGGGYVDKCGGGKLFLGAREKVLLAKHNEVRRDHDLRPLCVHPALQRAARAHSRDMIRRDFFSHDARGESACERIRRFGYRWRYCAENIGYDSTPNHMFNAWMQSPGHQSNILSSRYREIGIGAHTGDYDNLKTTMYTVDFGTRP